MKTITVKGEKYTFKKGENIMRNTEERPSGIMIKELCLCGCGEHIIHSYNRIKRGLPPPKYKWGHFGRISLKKFRFKKGNIPWDKGIPRSKATCKKISETKRANKNKEK